MNFDKLTNYIDHLYDTIGVPSAQIAVMKDGKEIYYHAAGYMDAERTVPLRRDALYNMWSCSKVCTTMAGMQLIEEGKLLLQDKVEMYIPEFAGIKVCTRNEKNERVLVTPKTPLRVFHLFTMTGGLNYDFNMPEIKAVLDEKGNDATTADVVAAIARRPLDFHPGTHWRYSFGHDVLARVIEVVSGQRFADYVKEHIFDPIGMKNSYFHADDAIRARMAMQFKYDDAKKAAFPVGLYNAHIVTDNYDSGGAGIISCLDDYLLLAETMTRRGVAPNGNRVLGARTVDLWRSDCLTDATRPDFDWSQFWGYGYGLGVRTLVAPQFGGNLSNIGDFGWGGAAGSYVHGDPAGGISIVYMQHMLNNKESIIHPRFRNLVYAAIYE